MTNKLTVATSKTVEVDYKRLSYRLIPAAIGGVLGFLAGGPTGILMIRKVFNPCWLSALAGAGKGWEIGDELDPDRSDLITIKEEEIP